MGVQRQYTGTAGRTENAQVAVYLAYAAPAGAAFIDRALYLPRSWTSDPARCRAAGVPEDTAFATKPALAKTMITRALDAGTPAAWVTADEVYGQDPALRAELARRGLGYVLAIPKPHLITTPAGACTAIKLAKRLPARAWQRMSAGPGAKGPRWYDWALIEATDPAVTDGGGPHWLLIRRGISDGEYAFYRAHAPRPGAAGPAGEGSRVAVEDRGRVRRPARNSPPWTSTRSAAGPPGTGGPSWPCSPARSCPSWPPPRPDDGQPRRRPADPADPPRDPQAVHRPGPAAAAPAIQLHWSRWRRRHQATARACHYRRTALALP